MGGGAREGRVKWCSLTINLANGSLSGSGNQMSGILKPAAGMVPSLARARDTNWGAIQACPALTPEDAREAHAHLAHGRSAFCGGRSGRPRGTREEGQSVPGLCSQASVRGVGGAVVCVRSRRLLRGAVRDSDGSCTLPPHRGARSGGLEHLHAVPPSPPSVAEEPDPDGSDG